MNSNNPPSSQLKAGTLSLKARLWIIILELSLVLFLLVLWLSSKSIQESKSLWVLFLYNFPSQFLIAVVAHEPVFFYFSKYYSPITVTAVAIAGTLITEFLNYSVFGFFAELEPMKKVFQKKFFRKFVTLFNKAPFIALLVAGLTPVPFYPLRFLVVIARYPLNKYLLALFLSRTPRFYLFAILGNAIRLPDYLLLVLFLAITVIINIPLIRNLMKKEKSNVNSQPD
ncbi:MAG: VTT domain-containing protein [bacterium]